MYSWNHSSKAVPRGADALIIKLQMTVEKPGQMQLLPSRFIFISSRQMT